LQYEGDYRFYHTSKRLPHYLVKPMTSKIDVVSRHNDTKYFLETFYAAHSYRLPVNFRVKLDIHTEELWRHSMLLSDTDMYCMTSVCC